MPRGLDDRNDQHGEGRNSVEFDEMLAAQEGRCAICGAADPQHLDHDRRTGWVRGILCLNCNGGLGRFRDDPRHSRKQYSRARHKTAFIVEQGYPRLQMGHYGKVVLRRI